MIPEKTLSKVCGCGSSEKIETPRQDMHYSDIRCRSCGFHFGFGTDPEKKPKSRKGQADLVKKYSKGFCEICLRTKQDLPLPEVLEAHHIIEVARGGDDEAENIQICCTPCHRWIHHQRTYLGHYHKQGAA